MSEVDKDIEPICAAVHKAYCEERIRQGKEPYWTNGDYNKLDEATKDYDRATVFAVLKAIALLEKEPSILATVRRNRDSIYNQNIRTYKKLKDFEAENKRLREALGIIHRNIEKGAVSIYWVRDYAKRALNKAADQTTELGAS